ncbi:hypothetical protein [Halobacterium hubeiense]|uniref:hypothetical protein n=1 Tax=Halobacterium hubeiense TaxID=1407499 RepID=UPI003C78D1C4
MTTQIPEDVSASFEGVLETIDDEIEELATSGGITADTRGDLSVDTLLRIARWRSVQSAALYGEWADQRGLAGLDAEVALAAAWKAGQSVEQYEAAADQLSSHGVELEPVEYEIHGGTLQYMAGLDDPVARLTAGFVVAPKLRVVKDKQATLVATGSADPQTASLYRDTIVPPEEAAIERGRRLLARHLDDDPSAIGIVEATAADFLDAAWESQEQAMGETGEVDPKTVC